MGCKEAPKTVVLDDAPAVLGAQASDEVMTHRAGVKRAPPVEADRPSKQKSGAGLYGH